MDEALAVDGRVAIVTGAGNGLGRAESLALARAGARLVLNDLPGDAVQAVADEIAAAGGWTSRSPSGPDTEPLDDKLTHLRRYADTILAKL